MQTRYVGLAGLLWCLSLPGGGLAAEKVTVRLSNLPVTVVERQPLPLTVAYEVAPELGEVTLHVEMKSPRHSIVLASQTARVRGRGETQISMPAPLRSQESEVLYAVWFGEVWTESLVPIQFTDTVAVITEADAATLAVQERDGERWRSTMQERVANGGALGVLDDDLPGFDRALAGRVAARMEAGGLPTVRLSADDVCNPYILNRNNVHTLVLPTAAVYPLAGVRALERFLAEGGSVIALGTPAFRELVRDVGGKWRTEAQLREALAQVKPERVLLDFESGGADGWDYTGGPGHPATWGVVAGGADGTEHALHVAIPRFESWNTVIAPELSAPPSPDQNLTCFWAKGGPDTTQLAVEWVERDGSRWIATVQLSSEWRHYALLPHEFRYWHDNPSQGRGGPADQLQVANGVKLTFGLAMTHTPLPVGRHEFWVDEVGLTRSPFGPLTSGDAPGFAPIEGLTPAYKFHRVTNAASLGVSDKQCLLPPAKLPVPAGLMAHQPRPQGTGYGKERKWRFIPLMEARDKHGVVCGIPACLIVNKEGRLRHAMVASFALPPAAYDDRVLDLVVATARRMRDGVFLFEGGAQYYAHFEGEAVRLGAEVVDLRGPGTADDTRHNYHSVGFEVRDSNGRQVFAEVVPVADGRAETTWTPGALGDEAYRVTCTLRDAQQQLVDSLRHPLVVWRPTEQPEYMTVENGQFMLRGRPWRAHGVNYMPASGIGIEDGPYFEYWMGKQAYDPEVIDRDLRRVKAMGMNMVSVFCYYESLGSRNLLDILWRCRRLGLMVNLSLRPGTPLDFRWEEMKALIEEYRLAQNDTVFAYDLAWEPTFGDRSSQRRWDAEWERWIIARYGSLANAEADWGVPVPREEGRVAGPSNEQLSTEGPHRVMVCAYRRFLDDLLAKYHQIARDLVRSIDPRHLISFRMSIAGDPTVNPAWIGYDFRGLARSVDIMEPEGYGRIGDWERVKPGRFTADYSRAMAPGRPVMWAEFGWAPYGPEAWDISPDWQQNVAAYYNRFYRMAYQSGANGTVCWWYPGGFRYGENSDYGIINPDGTWRPVSKVISDWAEGMTRPWEPAPVDEWLVIDRDASVKGIVGCYEAVKERYWALIEAGKNPGLRTDGHGLTSATAPRVAVGNTPYRPGRNPHKYLNAEIDSAMVITAPDGSRRLRVVVGNTGEAKWLARAGEGQVSVRVSDGNGIWTQPLAADVPFMGTGIVEVPLPSGLPVGAELSVQMHADPDIVFGERVTVRLHAD